MALPLIWPDHCRIGSLENQKAIRCIAEADHCRIGSLENAKDAELQIVQDHCRIGSLENIEEDLAAAKARSLPHRQLRK